MASIDPTELHMWLRADYQNGVVYWKRPMPRLPLAKFYKPVGWLDDKGYIQFQGQQTYVHIVIYAMFHGWWPSKLIDHIDRMPTNNSIRTLREATRFQNAMNNKRTRLIWA